MHLTLIAFLSVILGLAPGLGVAQEKPARHFEKAAGFSFVPPKGWLLTDAAAMAKADAPIRQAAEDHAKQQNAGLEPIKRQIMEQIKRAQPGSLQDRAFKQQLALLELHAKQHLDAVKKITRADPPILVCGPPDDPTAPANPAPSISFSWPEPVKDAKGKVEKTTLAGVVAQYKHVAQNTNKFTSLVSAKKWKTDAGVEGMVLVTDLFPATYLGDVDDRVRLRITQYILQLAPGRVAVATCTVAWDSKVDPGFEASLKTLRLEKP